MTLVTVFGNATHGYQSFGEVPKRLSFQHRPNAEANVKCKAQEVMMMKTLLNTSDRNELLDRLAEVRSDSQPRWGSMSAHQMICHLSDSFRAMLGEKTVSPSTSFFKRTVLKRLALWVPVPWPHGFKTRPEIDQQLGGTRPVNFASDMAELRILFSRFCGQTGKLAPHPMFGQLSEAESMRHAYLHTDHHLRQFGT